MNRFLIAPVAAIVCMATPVLAADKIDNPQYKQWSVYKAGTSVTMKTDADMAGNKMTTFTTTKLVEVTADKLVLEMTTVMEMAGNKMPPNTMKMDVPAKIEKPAEVKVDEKAPKPKEGEEELTVDGKKVKCKWIETTTEQSGMKTVSKVWTSDTVPGNVVKMETTMSGSMAGTSKGEVTEIKIVK